MSEEEKKTEEIKEEAKTEEPKAEEKPEEAKAEEPKKEEAKVEDRAEAEAKAGEEPKAEEEPKDEKAKTDDKKGGPRGKGGGRGAKGGDDKKKKSRRKSRSQEETASEFTEKVVQVRRVTKVVKGGKKLSFRTTVIIGNEKGKVGVGVGKASEVLTAIKKAISDAKKNLVEISTVTNTNTISHKVYGIASGSKVLLQPAADGTGIIAGGTARIVLELAGVGDVLAKSQGSKSPLNVARATINALGQLRKFQEVANLRGLSVKKMLFA